MEWHGHNDYHNVVTASTASWLYGGASVNAALLGIGERTGNCPLEAMLFEYAQLKGSLGKVNLPVLNEIVRFFKEELSYTVDPKRPFVGSEFNMTKAGIHADGLLKDESIYNSFDTNKLLNRPRNFNDKDRMPFLEFFPQHRKYGFEIVLISQNMRQIDRQIRDLIEIEVIHRKLNNFSLWAILPFPLFVAIERNNAIKAKNDHEFFLYSKKVGNLYDTFYDFTEPGAHSVAFTGRYPAYAQSAVLNLRLCGGLTHPHDSRNRYEILSLADIKGNAGAFGNTDSFARINRIDNACGNIAVVLTLNILNQLQFVDGRGGFCLTQPDDLWHRDILSSLAHCYLDSLSFFHFSSLFRILRNDFARFNI